LQTIPYPGASWEPEQHPTRQPQEYLRQATAKLLTLFHPATGRVRVKGVRRGPKAVLHPWLKEDLSAILATLPPPAILSPAEENRARWERWREGLKVRITLSAQLPPLRMLLIWDHLAGHQTPELMLWRFAHGIMSVFTPLGGRWLNLSESVQRILKRRALEGQHPTTPEQIIDWLEATARGWNRDPTAFEWGGTSSEAKASWGAAPGRGRVRGVDATPHPPVQKGSEEWLFS
jgi:hypothetical protein